MTHVLRVNRIPEQVVRGKRLGRHVLHDSRSLAYAWRLSGGPVVTTVHPRLIEILDQGDVGSCTGNAETGCLGTAPFFATLTAPTQKALNEKFAVGMYSDAEDIDGDGPCPPNDNGSTGLSVCKVAKNRGLISGYKHCLSVPDMVDALQNVPVIVGVPWFDSFDEPDANGIVSIAPGALVRGGHEFLIRGTDVDAKMFLADNSWGNGWGKSGSFSFSWATMAALLKQEGDCTVSVPLSEPAPVPSPVPVVLAADAADLKLAGTDLDAWANKPHVGLNKTAAARYKAWRAAKTWPGA